MKNKKGSWKDGLTPSQIAELENLAEEIRESHKVVMKELMESVRQGEDIPDFMDDMVIEALKNNKRLN